MRKMEILVLSLLECTQTSTMAALIVTAEAVSGSPACFVGKVS